MEYHVFFGREQEVNISSDFIWHFGENVTGKINPEEIEWIRMQLPDCLREEKYVDKVETKGRK